MNLTLVVVVFLSINLDFTTAAVIAGCTVIQDWKELGHASLPKTGVQKSLRATGDNGQTGNMSVAFVPLISIIANLLPRFLNRYSTVPSATVQQARSHLTRQMACYEMEHLGMKWPDTHSSFYYYQCSLTKNCFTAQPTNCYEIKQHQCGVSEVFDAALLKCLLPQREFT